MKETDKKENEMILLKLRLYLMSLWLLFFMLMVLKADVSDIPFKLNFNNIGGFCLKNIFSIICLLLIFIGFIGWIGLRDKLKNAKELPVEIIKCESVNYENLSFLATFIIPLVCFPLNTDREMFVLFAVIIVIGCIFAKTYLYYSNLSLVLLGFNVYRIETDSENFSEGILIVEGKIKVGDDISYLSLSDNAYYGRRVKQ